MTSSQLLEPHVVMRKSNKIKQRAQKWDSASTGVLCGPPTVVVTVTFLGLLVCTVNTKAYYVNMCICLCVCFSLSLSDLCI